MAAAAAVTIGLSGYGAVAITADAVASASSPDGRIASMQQQMTAMQAKMAAVTEAAQQRAALVEKRQALIAAVLAGREDPAKFDIATNLTGTDLALADQIAPFGRIEKRQADLAMKARKTAEARYAVMSKHLRSLGLNPNRFAPAMGGPYEPVDVNEQIAQRGADKQFRSLFAAWKKLDSLEQAVISIPSLKPVDHVRFSSMFGVRSDPFNGSSAMHTGVDIPGPRGTPVYATADGIIDRAGRAGGYGNMIEINHGRGIQTRYGHLSKILVKDHERVHRGQEIALMGSTGRSTGSHLHYEVRIDGHAVNPVPYLEKAAYLADVQDSAEPAPTKVAAIGGPAD
ncbi:M23 family metallopeptidase [Stakelama saccharophila]|uniref:M23 family metallopeptidase n=1 Tax=Stakelama saccharophila TaxID=3075605 RepID=A0ABZ0BBW3_9SPHN|nr:M23 family metallopeptidase [Stakelama sp. W311]WNO54920.1 M23 family metallopeptidase [Stakelama sp. W311]